jgi:hypothetical protein
MAQFAQENLPKKSKFGLSTFDHRSVAMARLKDRLAVEPDRFLAELSRPTANGSLATQIGS